MPARLLPLAALSLAALALLLAAPATAQPPVLLAAHAAPAVADTAPSLAVYAGRYATDGGAVEVRAVGGGLALTVHGAAPAAALAGLLPSAPARDARAAELLGAWAAGDIQTLADAAAPADRRAALSDLAAARTALTRRWGAVRSAELAGTFQRTDGRRVSLAHVAFERGAEWLSLVWGADGRLETVTRGLGAVELDLARRAGPDAFAIGTAVLRFSRDAEGRVAGLTVGPDLVAQR